VLVSSGSASKPAVRTNAAAPPRRPTAGQVEEILKRNIFCSTCPPILPVEGRPRTSGGSPLQRTALNLKLLAIMFAPPLRRSALVACDHPRQRRQERGLQRRVADSRRDHRRHRRGPGLLDFGGGRREYLDLLDRPQPAAGAPAVAAATPADPLSAELDKGIKKTGEHNYEVQRSTLDSLLGNMGALARARASFPRPATASPPASACSASGPTDRSRRSAS
jgi:hypothetical protein